VYIVSVLEEKIKGKKKTIGVICRNKKTHALARKRQQTGEQE